MSDLTKYITDTLSEVVIRQLQSLHINSLESLYCRSENPEFLHWLVSMTGTDLADTRELIMFMRSEAKISAQPYELCKRGANKPKCTDACKADSLKALDKLTEIAQELGLYEDWAL